MDPAGTPTPSPDSPLSLGQGRLTAKAALSNLREVLPDAADVIQVDLTGKKKALVAWTKPKPGSDEAKALTEPLTLGALKQLAKPFYDHLRGVAPTWVEHRLQKPGQGSAPDGATIEYPWSTLTWDDAAPARHSDLKLAFAPLDFPADDERGAATDGIPDLWEEAVVHADTTGKWKDIGQINLLNAVQIGAKSPAGPPPNTFALHAARQIDRRIEGRKAADSLAMFLDYQANGKASIFKRNPKFWAADLGQELTCMSPWNAMDGSRRAGVLITPRHILVAHHFPLNPGTLISFISLRNENIVRKTLASVQVPNKPRRPNMVDMIDFDIVVLDADLPPEISPCHLAPRDFEDYLPPGATGRNIVPSGPFIPALGLNQEEEGFVNQLSNADLATSFTLPQAATEPQRAEFKKNVIMYDSGNPSFFLVNGKLMLTTIWAGGGGGSGASACLFIPAIDATIAEVDKAAKIKPTGYKVTETDLSGFLKY